MNRRFAALALLAPVFALAGGIAQTEHNLSTSGPGPVKASTESQVCVFCHTPHDANPEGPLWNHQLPNGVTYTVYTSPTLDAYSSQATAPQPNGASRLCLSCHDGTVALGAVVDRPAIALAGGKTSLAGGDVGYLGTDLSKTHPISFVVTDQLIATNNAKDAPLNPLAQMKSDPDVHLDAQDRVQCTSCHEPHSDANFATSGVHFYAKPARGDPCLVCHATPPTDMGPHNVVAAAGAGGAPAQGIAHASKATLPQGCASCHRGHASGEGQRALLFGRDEEACYRCHGAGRAGEVEAGRLDEKAHAVDVEPEFRKPSHHPIEWPGDHRPDERFPESDPNARRHVKCVDCHDAHATLTRDRPAATETKAKASTTRRFATEAQLCLLCHGPAANRPARQPDVQAQFSSASFHPVLAPGRADSVPSLLSPLTPASAMSCTDCHGNDDPSGPAGPHGSNYPPLLVRAYSRDDNLPESESRYDLCYRCHSRASILADQSFPSHRKHVVELRAPCAACHTAHGSDQPHLVAFDPELVKPNAKGLRAFVPQGQRGGQCFLSCHGADHDPAAYCGTGVPCPRSLQRPGRAAPLAPASPVPDPASLFPGWPGP